MTMNERAQKLAAALEASRPAMFRALGIADDGRPIENLWSAFADLAATGGSGIGLITDPNAPLPEADGLYASSVQLIVPQDQPDFAINQEDPGSSGTAYLRRTPGQFNAGLALAAESNGSPAEISTGLAGELFAGVTSGADVLAVKIGMPERGEVISYLTGGAAIGGNEMAAGWGKNFSPLDVGWPGDLGQWIPFRFGGVSPADASTYAADLAAIFSSEPATRMLMPGLLRVSNGVLEQVYYALSKEMFDGLMQTGQIVGDIYGQIYALREAVNTLLNAGEALDPAQE